MDLTTLSTFNTIILSLGLGLSIVSIVLTVFILLQVSRLADMNVRIIHIESFIKQILQNQHIDAIEHKYDSILEENQPPSFMGRGFPPMLAGDGKIIALGAPNGKMYTGKDADEVVRSIQNDPDSKLSKEDVEKLREILSDLPTREFEDEDEDDDEEEREDWKR